jgi:hypothetical protein
MHAVHFIENHTLTVLAAVMFSAMKPCTSKPVVGHRNMRLRMLDRAQAPPQV